jgi:hypothetical protein
MSDAMDDASVFGVNYTAGQYNWRYAAVDYGTSANNTYSDNYGATAQALSVGYAYSDNLDILAAWGDGDDNRNEYNTDSVSMLNAQWNTLNSSVTGKIIHWDGFLAGTADDNDYTELTLAASF